MFKLSIIVPVYNVEKYLRQCLDSILQQSMQDFEIIIVDDGATDSSGDICDKYAERDNRIKVIHQRNGGLSAARNTGLKYARGKYIAFVDSDDYIAPNMYEVMIDKLEQCDADMVKCGYYEFVDDRITYTRKFESAGLFDRDYDKEKLLVIGLKDGPYTVVWNAVYTRELAQKVTYPEGLINEDNYASPMYLLEAACVIVIQDALYYYRQNFEGLSKNVSQYKKPLDIIFCQQMLLEELCIRGYKDGIAYKYLCQSMSENIYKKVKKNTKTIHLNSDMWSFVLENLRFDRKLKLRFWRYLGRVKVE